MSKDYRYREPKSVKEAWKRLKHRIIPAVLAGLNLALLVFLLEYFNIDKAYGLGTSAVIFTSFASSIYIMFRRSPQTFCPFRMRLLLLRGPAACSIPSFALQIS